MRPTAASWGPRARARIALLALAGGMLIHPMAFPAFAQEKAADEAKAKDGKDDTLDKAGRVATQPARDVGIAKTTIDPVLQEAIKNPYAPAGNGRCAAINAELTRLNAALGPDFDTDVKANEDKAEQLALAGGQMLVNTLIPFRGLVREISGAAPAERRKASAISAGTARRGYLRGLGQTLKCKVPANPVVK
ncbi:MAG TPA: hypothetical protein VNS79_10095 [Sphingobium sp.]|nr:hypothetical protein [Sphingobium sp.]